ncbi:MAG: bifunctional riboflavin kinase/FAD synthetase [Thermodesulfovibrionia bacterium]
MKVIDGIENIRGGFPYPVLTIGNFDGIHLGHQAIFKQVVQAAKREKGTSMVLTFQPHPLRVISPERAPRQLTTFKDKVELIRGFGIDYLICINFTKEFSNIEAEDFVKRILVDKIGVKGVFIGSNYLFGRGRKGNPELLKRLGKAYGFSVTVVDELKIGDVTISSSKIRSLISNGKVEDASRLLGRPYSVMGTVIKGARRGRKILHIPTANLTTPNELLPKDGVYAVTLNLEGKTYGGAANIGYNPTFEDKRFSFEVHILDFNKDILGKDLRVNFIKRLRDEIRFNSPNELAEQLKKDIEIVREILKDHTCPK